LIPSIRDPQSISYAADWAEFFVIYFQKSLSRAELITYLEQSSGSENNFDIDGVWHELERRKMLYGDKPPYKIFSGYMEATRSWKERPEYIACLLWSLRGNTTETTIVGKLFERLSGEAAKKYLSGNLIIYGHPAKHSISRIANAMKEKFSKEPAKRYKDRGVDLVVLKDFDDDRVSKVILLLQCASGQNWKTKVGTLPHNTWDYYINWGCRPLCGFTVPVVIRDDEMWDISTEAGLLIDRSRIYRNMQHQTDDSGLRRDLLLWVKRVLPSFINS